jgi:hypothetical protein
MSRWQCREVPFKYQMSDWTLFSVPLRLQVRTAGPFDESPISGLPTPPVDEIMTGSQGFVIRSLPVTSTLPVLSHSAGYICYVPLQYQHCYIDLSMTFEEYQRKFSSKTRSTIKRKIAKYSEHCGGTVSWKSYRRPEELREFHSLARAVSRLTYQERLLDAGIPDSEEFVSRSESLAAMDQVRAYILFDRERPVSYLYCPAQNGILIYAYLGYDPEYMRLSVGTILQWLALEELFNEGRFRYFDFTEGQSEHKRLFATHQRECANVFLLKPSARAKAIVRSHEFMNRFSARVGKELDRLGARAKLRRILRFAR